MKGNDGVWEYRNNGWKRLDIAGKSLEMDENGWKWLKIAGNG